MKKHVMRALLAGAALTAAAWGAMPVSAEETEVVTEAAEETEVFTDAAEEETEALSEAAGEEEDEENYDTGDASLDNIRNQDEIGDKELLVVSFGTSYNDSRRLTIGAIENALEEAYPDWSVRRAFTAQIIIDHVERRDGLHIDNVTEALERAVENGVKTLVVQPTHLMDGLEYHDLEAELAEYADVMDIYLGQNLLSDDEDKAEVEKIITEEMSKYDDGETAIVFMGHGTEAESNGVYADMQDRLTADGYENFYIGTVEAEPSLEDVMAAISDKGYKKVVLRPLMVVAGDHANNDMAAEDDPESWYSILTAEGYDVTCVLEGLGQIPAIDQMYVDHAGETIAEALGE